MEAQDPRTDKESVFLESILEFSPLGAFRADTEGRCLFINKQMECISGLTLQESLGGGWMRPILEEDIGLVQTFLQQQLAEKRLLIDFTYRLLHPQKGIRWCKVHARLILDKNETENTYVGFVEDITENMLHELALKEANAKLRQSELELLKAKAQLERVVDMLDASQELSQTGGWEYDVKTDAVFRTRQMKIMLGITDESTSLRDASLMYEEGDGDAIREAMKATIGRHVPYDLEIRPLGTKKWFRTIGRPVVKDGKVELVRGAIMDITERKANELALREVKEKLERSNHLLDVSQALSATAGYEFDLQTGEVFWTRQAYVLYDVGPEFIPTLENTLHFFMDEDRIRLQALGGAAISENRSYDIEVRVVTAKGNRKWVRSIGVPVTKDGRAVRIQGALMDVTQKKEIELELIRAKNMAEESARAKTDFLSVMSHEIRTPLNGIIGIANLLKLNYTTEQEEYIRNLIFCADHLLRLINDILDLTKMESEKLELVYAEVDLLQLVKNIRNQFKSLAESKGILLEISIGRGVPEKIMADPIRLGQILNNLVSNAIKFTEQGEVVLMLNLESKRGEKVVVRFSVKDTGIGIPEEMQEEVFESFKQVQQSAYRKHSGTGLGLTITRKLIQLHNSQIFLKSIPGFGSEFAFDLEFGLPDKRPSSMWAAAGPAAGEYAGKLQGLRLLLVEDNPINMLVACKQLEHFGIQPDCAEGGREALTLLSGNSYHVALLDLHMPEIDGYALAKIILRQYPDTHIIIFTADIMTEVKVKLAKMNIYDILNKPFAPAQMFEILVRVAQARNIPIPGYQEPPGAQ